jgi:serine protease inhibitor
LNSTALQQIPRALLAALLLGVMCAAQEGDEEDWVAEERAAQAAATLHAAEILDMESSGIARAESRFGTELLSARVAADPAANHLVAPLGAFTLLNLAAEGASAPLLQQLNAVLHVEPLDRPSLRRALRTLQGCFDRDAAQIDVACSVWVANGLALSPEFVAAGRDGYGATVANLDFGDPKAVDTINQWAADGTDGAIPAALQHVDPDTLLLLMTVTNFSAFWLHDFKVEETKPQAFTDVAGRKSEVMMMRGLQEWPYEHDANLGAQIVGLPCIAQWRDATDEMAVCSLYVILPDANQSVPAVLERLAAGPLRWRFSKLEELPGEVRLPRFRFQSEVALAETLGRLGLKEAAAFPGIVGGETLPLSDLRQWNSIEVDEKGVKASSVDTTTAFGSFHEQPLQFSFVADRPFIYVLFDDATGALLFAGVLVTPT